jgi:hypothetical protein
LRFDLILESRSKKSAQYVPHSKITLPTLSQVNPAVGSAKPVGIDANITSIFIFKHKHTVHKTGSLETSTSDLVRSHGTDSLWHNHFDADLSIRIELYQFLRIAAKSNALI